MEYPFEKTKKRRLPVSSFRGGNSNNNKNNSDSNRESKIGRRRLNDNNADEASSRSDDDGGRLVTIMPLTRTTKTISETSVVTRRVPADPFLWAMDVASYLAVRDFNRRQSVFLQEFPSTCNWKWTSLEMRDSQLEPLTAVGQYEAAFSSTNNTFLVDNHNSSTRTTSTPSEGMPITQQPQQHQFQAIVGGYGTQATKLMAELAGLDDFPMLSAGSSSRQLDNRWQFPTFGRTVPTHEADSRAILEYWNSLGVDEVAVFYVSDDDSSYGEMFFYDFQQISPSYPIKVHQISYTMNTLQQDIQALKDLRNQTNYFLGIFDQMGTEGNPKRDWKRVAVELYRQGVMGQPDTSWILAEVSAEIVGMQFHVANNEEERQQQPLTVEEVANANGEESGVDNNFQLDLAKALNGSGCLLQRPSDGSLELLQEEWSQVVNDPASFELYKSSHALENMAFFPYSSRFLATMFEEDTVGPASVYSLLAYDTVMALGLAKCRSLEKDGGTQTPSSPTTSLLEALGDLEFHGASGHVRFDNVTRSRVAETMDYNILNLIADQELRHGARYDVPTTFVTIRGPETVIIRGGTNEIQETLQFVYPNGTSIPPPTSNVQEDLQLTSPGIIVFCATLSAICIFITIGAGIWTYVYRNKACVRESQPFFLGLLCVAGFIMSLAIIPLLFQEPMSQTALDAGCMSVPWFMATGFTLAFAALRGKISRINRVFKSAQAFQRVNVQPKDVLKPLIILMILNFSLLISWTIVAPLTWTRTVVEEDPFGRTLKSSGGCLPDSNAEFGFGLAVIILNTSGVVMLNYESYQARHLPSRWNETFYISLTNFTILESIAIGAPVFVLVNDDSQAFVLVFSLWTTVVVMAVMLPAFVPKILMNNENHRSRVLRLNQSVSVFPSGLTNAFGLFRSSAMLNNNAGISDTTRTTTQGSGFLTNPE